ncbi:MAG TPA: hypothetical protein VMU14_24800 [Acidimicrobiales bacterium]|nr:hypothetical protein [Acidimicrobiales bacterium]
MAIPLAVAHRVICVPFVFTAVALIVLAARAPARIVLGAAVLGEHAARLGD